MLIKKKLNFLSVLDAKSLRIQKFNHLILVSFLIVFSLVFIVSSNLINKKKEENTNNFKEVAKTNEFSNLTNFLISKINSPYEEINYVIKNNDTIEKILKEFKIRKEDIKNISIKLKEKKLHKIYIGRKLCQRITSL